MLFQNNNCLENMVLINGWATDYRIFGPKFLEKFEGKYNFIFPEIQDLENLELLSDGIFGYCKKNKLKKIDILGWSMGSFLTLDFIKKYSNKIKIQNVFLYAIRKKYTSDEIHDIKEFLNRNQKAYLIQFFKKSGISFHIIKKYQDVFPADFLINGLDYLEKKETELIIDDKILNKIKYLQIINSKDDKIAIFSDYPNIPKHPKISEIFLEEAGHLCNIQF